MRTLFFLFILSLVSCSSVVEEKVSLWAKPIEDYLKLGKDNFGETFDKSISTLEVFDNMLWFGYGDTRVNMGTLAPIEFRKFESINNTNYSKTKVLNENHKTPQRSEYDSGEERVIPFKLINGTLWQAGYDSTNQDELYSQSLPSEKKLIQGNVFKLEKLNEDYVFKKYRNINGGEHVHDIAFFNKKFFAVGSGADNREEWENGFVYRYIWESDDSGKNFKTFYRKTFDRKNFGDTRFRALLSTDNALYVFGYLDPKPYGLNRSPINLVINKEMKIAKIHSKLSDLLVWKTYQLSSNQGLIIGNVGGGISKTFFVSSNKLLELTSWDNLRVVYVNKSTQGKWLLLTGDGNKNESFEIYQFTQQRPDSINKIYDLGKNKFCSIANWQNKIFLGSCDGKIYRIK
tara:strand:- start:7544 stop:8749 length:1206 start_codon:yes stop_codon:yes gene_type:complete